MTIRARSAQPTLEIVGLVEQDSELAWDELAGLEPVMSDLGTVAPGFLGEAIAISAILESARPMPDARFVTVVSDDGHYTASIPLGEIIDSGWLAFRLNGEPLPRTSGGPLRVVVPQGKTLCWNVKGVCELRLTESREPDSVPARPKH